MWRQRRAVNWASGSAGERTQELLKKKGRTGRTHGGGRAGTTEAPQLAPTCCGLGHSGIDHPDGFPGWEPRTGVRNPANLRGDLQMRSAGPRFPSTNARTQVLPASRIRVCSSKDPQRDHPHRLQKLLRLPSGAVPSQSWIPDLQTA